VAATVFESVVVPTQELKVVEPGLPATLPGDYVIDVAPFAGSEAIGILTVTITGDHRSPESGRNHASLATHIEDLGVRSQEDAAHGGVAPEALDLGGGQHRPIAGFAKTVGAVEENQEMWLLAPLFRKRPRVERPPSQVGEAISSPLFGCSLIPFARWRRGGIERGPYQGSRLRVEPAAQPPEPLPGLGEVKSALLVQPFPVPLELMRVD
jgi:hypothetical protein